MTRERQRGREMSPTPSSEKSFGSSRCFISAMSMLWDLARKDPRRVIHAVKMGLALCLTSLFMLVEEPPRLLGENAIWAIMTVVVVFEFTVGATLGKGLNRGLGTLLGALAGVGISRLADFFSEMGEATVILVSIFLAGALATFIRFIPWVKARYDYSVLISLLTFSLICVSSYQRDNGSFTKTATTRLFNIIVGCGISLVICMLVMPVWAGEDLHKMIANNLETLGRCIEGSVKEYLKAPVTTMQAIMETEDRKAMDDDENYNMYRSLLSSIQAEESLAAFAGWEPPHGRFWRLGYPWKEYVKVGSAIRHCAYASMALHGCLQSEVQAPYELRQVFQHELLKVSSDASDVLKVLASNIMKMQKCLPANALLTEVTASTERLQESIDSRSHLFVNGVDWRPRKTNSEQDHSASATLQRLTTMSSYKSLSIRSIASASNFSLSTFASLLIETVARLENVVESVENLGQLAKFKLVEHDIERPPPEQTGSPQPRSSENLHEIHRQQSSIVYTD